jgi:hypothetical protein
MEQKNGVDPTTNDEQGRAAAIDAGQTDAGATLGKTAPVEGDVEYKTSANTVLASIRVEAKKLIGDLENVPGEVRDELHKLWDEFHARAAMAISEAPAV